MKKILLPALAILAIVGAPAAYARTMHPAGGWYVLMDGNFHSCFTADRGATAGEVKIAGPYATQAKANTAQGAAIACLVSEPND